ncbi:MAG: Mur ligase domain-containing protein, partial [Spirochaetota bacterium]
MRIAALAHGLNHARLSYGNRESEITDITNDSRRVSSGALYAALPGAHVDGNAFVPDAIACGARAILTTEVPPKADPRLGWLTAREPRLALSEISDRFYGSPS